MALELCIIDDAFMVPATKYKLESFRFFSKEGLAVLMADKRQWDTREIPVFDFCESLVKEASDGSKRWELRAFTNPEFFINAFDENNYRADIVIFDWEYSTGDYDQVEILFKILEKSHASIFIYSNQDTKNIQAAITDIYDKYGSRIEVISKDPEESYSILREKVEYLQKNNFAFKFGSELRNITCKSLNNILCKFGEMDFENVIKCLINHTDNSDKDVLDSELKQIISSKIKDILKESKELQTLLAGKNIPPESASELIEFTAEAVKNHIIADGSFLDCLPACSGEPSDSQLEDLWSYRLYHTPRQEDKLVRTGDLIRAQCGADDSPNNDVLYFVLNDDCGLQRFWKNCGGRLILVELWNLINKSIEIKSKTELISNVNSDFKSKITKGISSLTNGEKLKGIYGSPLLLPHVPIGDDKNYADFLLFPLHILSNEIAPPANTSKNDLKNTPLKYDNIKYERICSVSEQFVGPLKWAVLSQLYGWGSPDYPSKLQKNLGKKVGGIFS